MLDVLTFVLVCVYGMTLGAILASPWPAERDLLLCAWVVSVLLAGADLADGVWPAGVAWALSAVVWARRLGESYEVGLRPARR